MKRALLTFCILVAGNCLAQKPELFWAKSFGAGSPDHANSMVIDAEGNTYITGFFHSVVDFDPDSVNTYSLTSAGVNDIYVLKLSAMGNLLWVRQIGAELQDEAYSICLDKWGNVIVTGFFGSTVDFNSDPAKSFNMSSSGATDAFILKLDNDGRFIWARKFGSIASDNALSVSADNMGNIYSAGNFSKKIDMDPGTDTSYLTAVDNEDIFISKLDSSGKFVWAKRIGGPGSESLRSIAVDGNGNIYCNGDFQNLTDFDPGNGKLVLTTTGNNGFLLKLDSTGSLAWAKKTSLNFTWGLSDKSFTRDASGNIYATGYFSGTVDFNLDTVVANNVTAKGLKDMFVMKMDKNGGFIWVKTIGNATMTTEANSITLDPSNNIYTTGRYKGTVDFNPGTGTYMLGSISDPSIFILKLNSIGDFSWARSLDGFGDSRTVAADPFKNVFVAGMFSGVMDFDADSAKILKLASRGNVDIAVARFVQCKRSSSSITISACKKLEMNGRTYTASGQYVQVVPSATGCDSTISLNLTVTSIDTGVFQNGNQLFTRISGPGYTFQWIDCKTKLPIQGKVFPSFNPSMNGEYAVVISYNNCNDTSACFVVSTIGIDNPSVNTTLTVFPNPINRNEINLYISKTGKDICLKIVNAQGQVVHRDNNMQSGDNTVDISLLPDGIYSMDISIDGVVSRIKVVKSDQ
jgi:hypothetical protein